MEFRNNEWWGLSPFKQENTPSFSINPEKNVFKDFSSGKAGNIIDFICGYHNCNVAHAINILKEYLNVEEDVNIMRTPEVVRVMKKYRQKKKSMKPQQSKRKLLSPSILDKYEIKHIQEWESEGILKETYDSFNVRYDPFEDAIIIPIYDISGNLINLCRRTLDPNFKEFGIPKYIYKYPLGTLDFFYGWNNNFDSIKKEKQVILVEGAKSVMKLSQWGIKNSIAALTSHINDFQLKLLIKLGCDVVVAFDKDACPQQDEMFHKLKRFCKVEILRDKRNLLDAKDAPCDKGKDVWDLLFSQRQILR